MPPERQPVYTCRQRDVTVGEYYVKVADVVPEFPDAFSFDKFNQMQKSAATEILQNEPNVVVAAPTAQDKPTHED